MVEQVSIVVVVGVEGLSLRSRIRFARRRRRDGRDGGREEAAAAVGGVSLPPRSCSLREGCRASSARSGPLCPAPTPTFSASSPIPSLVPRCMVCIGWGMEEEEEEEDGKFDPDWREDPVLSFVVGSSRSKRLVMVVVLVAVVVVVVVEGGAARDRGGWRRWWSGSVPNGNDEEEENEEGVARLRLPFVGVMVVGVRVGIDVLWVGGLMELGKEVLAFQLESHSDGSESEAEAEAWVGLECCGSALSSCPPEADVHDDVDDDDDETEEEEDDEDDEEEKRREVMESLACVLPSPLFLLPSPCVPFLFFFSSGWGRRWCFSASWCLRRSRRAIDFLSLSMSFSSFPSA